MKVVQLLSSLALLAAPSAAPPQENPFAGTPFEPFGKPGEPFGWPGIEVGMSPEQARTIIESQGYPRVSVMDSNVLLYAFFDPVAKINKKLQIGQIPSGANKGALVLSSTITYGSARQARAVFDIDVNEMAQSSGAIARQQGSQGIINTDFCVGKRVIYRVLLKDRDVSTMAFSDANGFELCRSAHDAHFFWFKSLPPKPISVVNANQVQPPSTKGVSSIAKKVSCGPSINENEIHDDRLFESLEKVCKGVIESDQDFARLLPDRQKYNLIFEQNNRFHDGMRAATTAKTFLMWAKLQIDLLNRIDQSTIGRKLVLIYLHVFRN